LLRAANFLLFGHPDWDKAHEVSAALRPSTLRRQLHVMDTLIEAGVEHYNGLFKQPIFADRSTESFDKRSATQNPVQPVMQVQGSSEKEDKKDHWVRVLNRSTWALLNVHRDVLREFDLYLEDLYSWSLRALRRVVLDTLLAQDTHVRRALLRRWRDRADSRRSQVLSLLAMNMFKPWTPVEEPYGDDEYVYERPERTGNCALEGCEGLKTDTVCLWFLELTIGFYMPLALARPRVTDAADSESARSRVIGIGWGVESGPINAVRDADARQNMLPTGICFLSPEDFRDHLNPGKILYEKKTFKLQNKTMTLGDRGIEEENDTYHRQHNELMVRLWCFYGYSQGRFWSAVSFWRGLGLLARVLDHRRRFRYEVAGVTGEHKAEIVKGKKKKWEKQLRSMFRHHLLRGMVPVGMLGKISNEDQLRNISFKPWDQWDQLLDFDEHGIYAKRGKQAACESDERSEHREAGEARSGEEEERRAVGRDIVERFTDQVVAWLDESEEGECCEENQKENSTWNNQPLYAMPSEDRQIRWRQNFVRRLHGEDILGDFHLRLATTYMEEQEQFFHSREKDESFGLTAGAALLGWTAVLLEYWRGVYSMQRLLRSCPLLRPFVKGPVADQLRSYLLGQEYEKLRYLYDSCGKAASCVQNEACKKCGGRFLSKESVFIQDNLLDEFPQHEQTDDLHVVRVKEAEFIKRAATNLACLVRERLQKWQLLAEGETEEARRTDAQLKAVFEQELKVHWDKIGPLPAEELYKDQLRELYWANQEILTVRWLWSLKRVEWKHFEARKEEDWVRARVVEMADTTASQTKEHRPSRRHLLRPDGKKRSNRKPGSRF
jgi:hypothetical protein